MKSAIFCNIPYAILGSALILLAPSEQFTALGAVVFPEDLILDDNPRPPNHTKTQKPKAQHNKKNILDNKINKNLDGGSQVVIPRPIRNNPEVVIPKSETPKSQKEFSGQSEEGRIKDAQIRRNREEIERLKRQHNVLGCTERCIIGFRNEAYTNCDDQNFSKDEGFIKCVDRLNRHNAIACPRQCEEFPNSH